MVGTIELVSGGYMLDGKRLPRVSTILNVIAKPELEAWRHRVGLDEATRISRESAGLGTRIHKLCEAIMGGDGSYKPEHWPDDLRPFGTAFLNWKMQHVAEPVHIERPIYHPTHLYGGTPDLIAWMKDGRMMLWDYKSSKAVDWSYRLQLKAYDMALAAHGEPVHGRGVIHLPRPRPGDLHVVEYPPESDEEDARAWLACLRLYKYVQAQKAKRGRP